MDNKIFSKTVSLYSLAKWTNGLAYKDFHFSTTGMPIIKIAELKNGITSQTQFTNDIFDESVKLYYDDLLFSWSGNPDTSIDVFRYRRNDGWLNQHIFKVVPTGVSKDYLFYLLKSLQPTFAFIASNKQTTGLGHVTIADLKRLNVYVHSIKEQQHIVDILGSIDEKIENNDKIIHSLERDGELIFKDFIENKSLLKEHICLSDIATFYNGYSYSGDELCEQSDEALVTIKNFDRNGGFKVEGFKPIKTTGKIKPTMFVELGDLLVAHTDLTQNADIIGNPIIILNLGKYKKAIISMDLVKVESSKLSKELLYYILKNSDFKAYALGYCSGTTVLHLNKKALQEYEFDLPLNEALIEEVSNNLKTIFDRIQNAFLESQKLNELKQLYLKKFFG